MKHISIILALSILYYSLGCYRTKVIKQEEEILRQLKIENKVGSGDDQKGRYIKKTDGSRYYLIPQMYTVENDTVFANAQRIIFSERQIPALVKIALSDIKQIEIGKPVDADFIINPIKAKDQIRQYLEYRQWVNVTDNDSIKYFFNSDTYHIVNDTLQGDGQQIIADHKQDPQQFKIALADILEVEGDGDSEFFKQRISDNNKSDPIFVAVMVVGILFSIFVLLEYKEYSE